MKVNNRQSQPHARQNLNQNSPESPQAQSQFTQPPKQNDPKLSNSNNKRASSPNQSQQYSRSHKYNQSQMEPSNRSYRKYQCEKHQANRCTDPKLERKREKRKKQKMKKKQQKINGNRQMTSLIIKNIFRKKHVTSQYLNQIQDILLFYKNQDNQFYKVLNDLLSQEIEFLQKKILTYIGDRFIDSDSDEDDVKQIDRQGFLTSISNGKISSRKERLKIKDELQIVSQYNLLSKIVIYLYAIYAQLQRSGYEVLKILEQFFFMTEEDLSLLSTYFDLHISLFEMVINSSDIISGVFEECFIIFTTENWMPYKQYGLDIVTKKIIQLHKMVKKQAMINLRKNSQNQQLQNVERQEYRKNSLQNQTVNNGNQTNNIQQSDLPQNHRVRLPSKQQLFDSTQQKNLCQQIEAQILQLQTQMKKQQQRGDGCYSKYDRYQKTICPKQKVEKQFQNVYNRFMERSLQDHLKDCDTFYDRIESMVDIKIPQMQNGIQNDIQQSPIKIERLQCDNFQEFQQQNIQEKEQKGDSNTTQEPTQQLNLHKRTKFQELFRPEQYQQSQSDKQLWWKKIFKDLQTRIDESPMQGEQKQDRQVKYGQNFFGQVFQDEKLEQEFRDFKSKAMLFKQKSNETTRLSTDEDLKCEESMKFAKFQEVPLPLQYLANTIEPTRITIDAHALELEELRRKQNLSPQQLKDIEYNKKLNQLRLEKMQLQDNIKRERLKFESEKRQYQNKLHQQNQELKHMDDERQYIQKIYKNIKQSKKGDRKLKGGKRNTQNLTKYVKKIDAANGNQRMKHSPLHLQDQQESEYHQSTTFSDSFCKSNSYLDQSEYTNKKKKKNKRKKLMNSQWRDSGNYSSETNLDNLEKVMEEEYHQKKVREICAALDQFVLLKNDKDPRLPCRVDEDFSKRISRKTRKPTLPKIPRKILF